MDTKLKKYNILFKVAAFILIAASSFCMMLTLTNLNNTMHEFGYIELWYFRDFGAEHYSETSAHWNKHYRVQSAIDTILGYKSEQNILDGNTVSHEGIDDEIQNLFNSKEYLIRQRLLYTLEIDDTEYYENNITYKMLWDKFQEDYKAEIENVKNVLIQNQLSEFRNAVYGIEHTPNIYYYISVGGNVISNKDFQSIASSKYSYEQTLYESDRKTVTSQAAFSFDEKYINDLNAKFLIAKHDANRYIIQGSVCLLLFLMGLSYLIFAAGKKTASPQGIHHIFIDRIYNEITAFLLFLSGCAVVACGAVIAEKLFNITFMYILLVSSVLLVIAFILVLVRHIKSRTLLKHTVIFSVFHFIFKAIKKIYDAGSPMIKAFVLVAVLGLFTAIPFVFLITLPLALVFTYMQLTKYIAVKNGVKKIKNGIYSQKIEVKGNGEAAALAADINDISAGLGQEVERRLKSERLKTELIVNVSHDIKTPLTSVITYVDLLKKENIDNENAQKYIDVIAGKSDRLKMLIDDLFDASKAASGNIPVNYENVDIGSLVTQGLGELDDKIKESSLDFKISLPQEKIVACADGRLTWRVLDNLLSNVFKYSLANSRVYIDVFEDEKNAYIEIKNISATELNIPEDEIMERFKRGDESRNSEGSGLGLDIAKSLMLCQNGELAIKIDGDLFKVKLKLSKIE
ncbi:MAG: sensor histidine kinase [Eubacteriales bacterium]|nr:sensor histidine kinase [Eubacteriales bacterium]